MLYAIRSFTSRHTSGAKSVKPVRTELKLAFAILFGWPDKWLVQEGDAIDDYNKAKKAKPEVQSRIHLTFFFSRYETHDPESMNNLRMLELRAVNYSKLYAERIASKLLCCSLVLLLIWTLVELFSQHC